MLEDLFRLDHLATRIRRNAESLLVLSGDDPPRRWGNPVPLADVVRAAAAEVEDYRRVEVLVNDHIDVAGRAVADLAHLLAELIENATTFSPPTSEVRIRSHLSPGEATRFVVTIEDIGIGMSDDDIQAANRVLAEAPEVDLRRATMLGFHVVARLAHRYGWWSGSPRPRAAGLTALVSLPARADQRASGRRPAARAAPRRRRPLPPGRPRLERAGRAAPRARQRGLRAVGKALVRGRDRAERPARSAPTRRRRLRGSRPCRRPSGSPRRRRPPRRVAGRRRPPPPTPAGPPSRGGSTHRRAGQAHPEPARPRADRRPERLTSPPIGRAGAAPGRVRPGGTRGRSGAARRLGRAWSTPATPAAARHPRRAPRRPGRAGHDDDVVAASSSPTDGRPSVAPVAAGAGPVRAGRRAPRHRPHRRSPARTTADGLARRVPGSHLAPALRRDAEHAEPGRGQRWPRR